MLKVKPLWSNLVLTALIGSSLTLGGCNGRGLATALGVVGIAAGAVAIGAAADDDHDHHHYHGHDHDHGHWHPAPPPRHHDRPGHPGHHRFSIDAVSSIESVSSTLSATDDVATSWIDANRAGTVALAQDPLFQKDWADHFSMSSNSAKTLLSAFVKAQSGDSAPLLEVGLSNKDLSKLGKLQMITDEGILSVSRTLGQNSEATRGMIQEIITQAKTFKINN